MSNHITVREMRPATSRPLRPSPASSTSSTLGRERSGAPADRVRCAERPSGDGRERRLTVIGQVRRQLAGFLGVASCRTSTGWVLRGSIGSSGAGAALVRRCMRDFARCWGLPGHHAAWSGARGFFRQFGFERRARKDYAGQPVPALVALRRLLRTR